MAVVAMSDLGRHLTDLAMEAVRAEEAVLEEWCEKSLTDPLQRGILIIDDPPETSEPDAMTCTITHSYRIGLSAEVPWMTIHRYPWGRDDER